MNSGYKGKIDLLGIGFEQFQILGEIKNPPKNWKASTHNDQSPDETIFLVVLDETRRENNMHHISVVALTVF